MAAEFRRLERRHRLRQQLESLLERCEPPALPDSVLWTTLSFCDLQDCGQAAGVSRAWRRAAEAHLIATLRASRRHVLHTRWAATSLGSDDADVPTERVRAVIKLAFDWQRGVGPVVGARVDLLRAVFALNRPEPSAASASPMCFFNTLPLAGHRIYRETWLPGSRGALEQQTREFPWSDAERRLGFRVDHVPDEDLPEASSAQLRAERTRYDAPPAPLVAAPMVGALGALSGRGFDGWLRLRLTGHFSPGGGSSGKRARASEVLLTLMPSHARVSVGRAHCDCFYGDALPAWRPLNGLIENLARRPHERVGPPALRPWPWTTEPLPLAYEHPKATEERRCLMARARVQKIEDALRSEGLRWDSVAKLREVDYLSKDALRFGGREGDFLAKQLGFTASRHRHALDLQRLVQYVRLAEERYADVSSRFAQQVGCEPRQRAELTSQVAQAMRCPVQQELALALAWRAMCAQGKGCAPPRPQQTGLVPEALVSCMGREEFSKRLSEEEVLSYKRQVGGPKADAILLSRSMLHTTAY